MIIVPLAFESYGRWGESAALELRRMARRRSEQLDVARAADAKAMYRGCLRRWRQEIAVCLQLGNFDAACATGLQDNVTACCPPDDPSVVAALLIEGS